MIDMAGPTRNTRLPIAVGRAPPGPALPDSTRSFPCRQAPLPSRSQNRSTT